MKRQDLAALLAETAVYLELAEANPFRAKAYANASRALLKSGLLEGQLLDPAALERVKGIGKGLAEAMAEAARTGRLAALEELKQRIPRGLYDMTRVPGLGVRKVLTLHRELGLTGLGELAYACQENRLANLKGFGAKSQENILAGVEFLKRGNKSFLYPEAARVAAELFEHFAEAPGTAQLEVAGSLRRLRETINRLDFLAVTTAPAAALTRFSTWIRGAPLERPAPNRAGIHHPHGPYVELEAVEPPARAAALVRATGNRTHLDQLARAAADKGLELRPEGLFRQGHALQVPDEQTFYRFLGLDWIPPELREGRGEVEAAARGELPRLVRVQDIKGVLHVHTSDSDGGADLETMARAALELGYTYLGLTDHSRTAFYAGGLAAEELLKQSLQVKALNRELAPFRIFHGVESDIAVDGSLDYPDEVLARLDFVIASVHSNFNLGRAEQTERLVKALSHPATTILGHPTGRLLLAREAYAVDMEAVVRAAADKGVALEINAHPSRLDTDWRVILQAKRDGLKLNYAVCPDAHAADGLTDTVFGVNTARKGWLGPDEVLNCLDVRALERHFRRRKEAL